VGSGDWDVSDWLRAAIVHLRAKLHRARQADIGSTDGLDPSPLQGKRERRRRPECASALDEAGVMATDVTCEA
jgi:hypothetical protein